MIERPLVGETSYPPDAPTSLGRGVGSVAASSRAGAASSWGGEGRVEHGRW